MRHRFLAAALAALFFVLAGAPAAAQQEDTRLLRFPHIHGDRVVFTYGGDLYTASLEGGQATRLTSHEGLELFAKFSPDGRWIAFSGEYAGTRQVYVMPSTGGEPRQLTFHPDVGPMPPRGGYDHLVLDWTPDGEKILVRANRTPFGQRVGRYFLVDPDGGLEVPLEIPEGGAATYDPAGTQLAYNIKSREWRHWKRYEGGRQQEVWLYDLEASSSQQITDFTGTDVWPMWVDDAVYFVSDRGEDRKLNLWRYDVGTEQMARVTDHDTFDVLWPSRGQGGIVYQSGGWIWHLDPATGESRKLSITVPGDRPLAMPYWTEVGDRVDAFDLSPSGNRAIFAARGELFSVPAEHGNTRNLSETPAERERSVAWSPDGRWLAYLSDATGAYELYVRAADGSGEPRQLTSGGESWIYGMEWSPNSEWIAWSDQRNRLRAVEVESGRIREVDQTATGRLNDYSWAPDSRWLAYSKRSPNTMNAVWLYSFDGDRATQVTGDMTDESSPAFDGNGRYLYFVSARDFDYGDRGFDARIFAATLQADAPHPFPPRSDEEPAITAAGDDEGEGSSDSASSPDPIRIDLDGLGTRIAALPDVSPGGYFGLTGTKDGVLYFSDGSVHLYDMEDRSAKPVVEQVRGYAVNGDRSKLMFAGRDGYGIVDVRPGQKTDDTLDLSGMEMRIDPRVEWAQVYHDAWRIMHDWFYDPGMHRVDWEGMYHKYRPLLDHVAHRADLDFILAELIAELNVGHAYVNSSPEMPRPDRVPVGLLGAEFEADGSRYRIANIFPGENWHENFRSPLTEPGIDVREGDYLIAIDGEDVTTDRNPYSYLVNKLDRIVHVTVSDRADGRNARTFEVDPVESELGLRYQEWVAENAALVDSLSGGRIGYIHLPNTAIDGHRELFEGFRPLHTKDALILDDRYNGGGFIPEEMALMLDRPLLNYWSRRNLELYSQPAVVHRGPKATLINGQASSGGDAFPYYFKELGLGPLIGTRTWGGLVGISGNPGFVDGGSINIPAFAFVNEDGEWAVEGEGVSPDIEVIDRPEEIAAGHEPIIERAVQYLLRQLEENPPEEKPETPVGPERGTGG
ncbi:MAG: PDZ domain-containing protein [Longimicrobiales bacterium]